MGASENVAQKGRGDRSRWTYVRVRVCLHICDGVSQSSPVSEMCEGSVTEEVLVLSSFSSRQHRTCLSLAHA